MRLESENSRRAKSLMIWFLGVLWLAVVIVSSSCSMVETRSFSPVVRMSQPPPTPNKSDLPYTSVNLDRPLTEVYKPELYVLKRDRRLLLVYDETLVREYRIALGPHPSGDKYFQGDGRTPEGEFFVCLKNPSSKYYKSLGLNYPTPKHAEEAARTGVISQDEFKCILQANRDKCLPPYNTSLGGAIFIHGGGAAEDWTLGCVAVRNEAMDELFEIVSPGTPVHILP